MVRYATFDEFHLLYAYRLQWNPIVPSKREHSFSKTEVVIIITLMTVLGLIGCLNKWMGG